MHVLEVLCPNNMIFLNAASPSSLEACTHHAFVKCQKSLDHRLVRTGEGAKEYQGSSSVLHGHFAAPHHRQSFG